ncbi:hypothetical protein H6G36_26975 [Anabaena minutissima FACHB-250]|nr:hypothetical protein [Anabaena minutissima FACHB-250]
MKQKINCVATVENLHQLTEQAIALLQQIKQHPQLKTIEYSPDFTVTDALAAVTELQAELSH